MSRPGFCEVREDFLNSTFKMAEDFKAAKETIASLERQLAEVRGERDEARAIVRDIHWMAVRYADNRKSYAVGMCNDAIRKAYDGGWLVYSESRQTDLDPQYARDGMFDKEWRSAVDNANDRATTAEAERDQLAARCGELEGALRGIIANDRSIVGSGHCRVESDGEYAAIARAALQEPQT